MMPAGADQSDLPQPAASPWRDVSMAAARALTSRRTIYNAVASGRLRAARVNGRRELRFLDEWVDAWILQSTTHSEGHR